MPKLNDILNSKLDRLSSVPEGFVSAVDRQNKLLLKKALKAIDTLARDSSGNIIANNANFSKVAEISDLLKKTLFTEDYMSAVNAFAKEFKKQAVINNKYFEAAFSDAFSIKKVYENAMKESAKNTISLLGEAGIDTNFINPLSEILIESISTSQPISSVIDSVNDYILGKENADGALTRYTKQVAFDGFAFSDRAYSSVISNDLEAVWFRYIGGEIKDTRCFCEERNGNYYHKKEIESWGDRKNIGQCKSGDGWQGIVSGTNKYNIFIYLGGYNCRHSLVPVSEALVPQSVISDANDKGYIT